MTDKYRKNAHKTIIQFLCPIFNDAKDWLTHKKNHLKYNV